MMNFHKNIKNKKLDKDKSLLFMFITLFFVLFIISISVIILIVFSNWRNSIQNSIKLIEQKADDDIYDQINEMISIPSEMNRINAELLKSNYIDLNNKDAREKYFAGMIKVNNPSIYSFSYGTEEGDYYGARRNNNNEIELYHSTKETKQHSLYYSVNKDLTEGDFIMDYGLFDPRSREWYQYAKKSGIPVFSPPYKHFVKDDLVLTATYPIYSSNGSLQGVLGTHITLSSLNHYLEDIACGNHMEYAYVVEKNTGYLVANSKGSLNFHKSDEGICKRLSIFDLDNKEILTAYENYISYSIHKSIVPTQYDKYHINIDEFEKDGLEWLIITALSDRNFSSVMHNNIRNAMLLSLVALIICVVVYIKFTAKILNPINNLVHTAEKLSIGDFTQRARIFRNDEIGKLAKMFNHMAEELNMLINDLEDKVKERTTELEDANMAFRQSEENIRLLLHKAEAANIAKRKFIANMSHEIRTPMNGIVGFLQLLETTRLSRKQSFYVRTIKTSADALLHVMNDILDISKIEAGRMELEEVTFHFKETFQAAVYLFDAKAHQKGLELHSYVDPQIPNLLVGDPVKLRQVISNFVSNSVKFTDQGHIYVTAVLEEETDQTTIIAFQVEDTGIGISQQEIDKLFQPFSQITTSSIHNYGGTGLGLAISKNFIEMMSGEITVSSTPGEGTIFQFTLRFNKAEAELASISPNLPDLVDTTNDNTDLVIPKESSMVDYTPSVIKILLAEDNEINIELFTSLLHMNGYFCDLAKNGIEAVNLCKNNHYDIIFMDCQMPELDGFDAAAKIRSMELSTEHTYIIALTSYATMEDVEKCKQSGMDDFISKPIHLDQVLQILKTVLVAKSNLDSSSSCDIM